MADRPKFESEVLSLDEYCVGSVFVRTLYSKLPEGPDRLPAAAHLCGSRLFPPPAAPAPFVVYWFVGHLAWSVLADLANWGGPSF